MAVQFADADKMKVFFDFAITQALLGGAHYFQSLHQKAVSIEFPPHSKPGEYLRKISGEGRASFVVQKFGPTSVAIGYTRDIPPFPNYMVYWEFHFSNTRKRIDFGETFLEYREEIHDRMFTIAKTAMQAHFDLKKVS